MITNRRTFLSALSLGTGLSLGGLVFRAEAAGAKPKVLVVVFQRGAVDGLSMVAPVNDARYQALRPTIALAKPNAPKLADADKPKPLDATFSLHPALAPLMPFWSNASLAFVHSVGSPNPTRSHFDAQDYVETGTPGTKTTGDGWLARALAEKPRTGEGPVRAVALQPTLPRILHGDGSSAASAGPLRGVVAFSSLADFQVAKGKNAGGSFEAMYEGALDEALRGAGHDAFAAMKTLDPKLASAPPQNGAKYPTSPLGNRLKQIAQLVRGDVGLEVAVTDCGGWDTHANQSPQLGKRLDDLGQSLAAFAIDLGDRMADVCVVTVTEFGRTVKENGTGGTDHGHGSVMAVLGGKVKGKRVLGKWKGLEQDALFEGRDLAVTTDHRSVFTEILRAQLGMKDTTAAFPGFTPEKLGLFG